MVVMPDSVTSFPHNLPKPLRTVGHIIRRTLSWITGAKRWRWIIASLGLFMGISAASVLIGVVVTPSQSVDALGQHFTINAVSPSLSFTGHGEITVNTGHPETFYLLPSRYYGPVRVHLTVDAPFQGSDLLNKAAIDHKLSSEVGKQFESGFATWLEIFAVVTFTAGLLLSVFAAFLVSLVRNNRRQAIWLAIRSSMAVLVNLALVATLFAAGSSSIARAASLDDLVGHSALHFSPKPMGPKLEGYDAVSIGDSRAATQGGKAIKNPTREDADCRRSSDSLAAQIGRLNDWRVLNLACSAATITNGLTGEQSRGGTYLIPQVSAVKQMTNIKAVFVTIGPNDLWWSRAIGLCYMADVCNDNLTTPDYRALLEQFKWNYHDLLGELQALQNGPGGRRPIVIINGSYDVFGTDTTCAALKGLTSDKINMLNQRNADLNQALQEGAGLFGFVFVKPRLKTLCEDLSDSPGPEIRGPSDPNAFHPTDDGVAVIASDDVVALANVQSSAMR